MTSTAKYVDTDVSFNLGTNLNYNQGPKDPRDGAKVIIVNSQTEKEKIHGKVVNEDGMVEPEERARSRLKLTSVSRTFALVRLGESGCLSAFPRYEISFAASCTSYLGLHVSIALRLHKLLMIDQHNHRCLL